MRQKIHEWLRLTLDFLLWNLPTGRSLIFRYKNQIHAKLNDFVNFYAQTNQFSSGSSCQIAKAETRKFQDTHIWA